MRSHTHTHTCTRTCTCVYEIKLRRKRTWRRVILCRSTLSFDCRDFLTPHTPYRHRGRRRFCIIPPSVRTVFPPPPVVPARVGGGAVEAKTRKRETLNERSNKYCRRWVCVFVRKGEGRGTKLEERRIFTKSETLGRSVFAKTAVYELPGALTEKPFGTRQSDMFGEITIFQTYLPARGGSRLGTLGAMPPTPGSYLKKKFNKMYIVNNKITYDTIVYRLL